MRGMKTTDNTSARNNLTKTPPARWYRARPALLSMLALSVTAWVGLASYAVRPGLGREEVMETATRFAMQYGSPVLNVLAALSVAAVIVQGKRTPKQYRRLRRKLARSMRVTQRLMPGARPARA